MRTGSTVHMQDKGLHVFSKRLVPGNDGSIFGIFHSDLLFNRYPLQDRGCCPFLQNGSHCNKSAAANIGIKCPI